MTIFALLISMVIPTTTVAPKCETFSKVGVAATYHVTVCNGAVRLGIN